MPREPAPFDFYQYWVNTEDQDVERFLSLYTLLPLEEIRAVHALKGQELNVCKTILAYEVTALTHGKDQALAAYHAASKVFGKALCTARNTSFEHPSARSRRRGSAIHSDDRYGYQPPEAKAYRLFRCLSKRALCSSGSAARRLIEQGGAYVNQERIRHFDEPIGVQHLVGQSLLLKAGKKKIHRIQSKGLNFF